MRIRKVFTVAVLMAMVMMLAPVSQVWAGVEGTSGAPDPEKVQGPELWAAVVIHCAFDKDDFGAMRVKRIKDCTVNTQALVDYDIIGSLGCPTDQGAWLYQEFLPNSFFSEDTDIPDNGNPIIMKIKNYEVVEEGSGTATKTTISFDAQIKFLMP
jgi:hypothetical protein